MKREKDTFLSIITALKDIASGKDSFQTGRVCRIDREEFSGRFCFILPFDSVALLLLDMDFYKKSVFRTDFCREKEQGDISSISYFTCVSSSVHHTSRMNYLLKKDTIYFDTFPENDGKMYFLPGASIQGLCIFFLPETAQRIFFMYSDQIRQCISMDHFNSCLPAPGLSETVSMIIRQLENCPFKKPGFTEIYQKNKMNELLTLFIYELMVDSEKCSIPLTAAKGSGIRDDDKEQVQMILDYLDSDINNAITLDKLALVAHMSKSKLTRTFKTVTGFTVKEYRTRLLINRAAGLLADQKNSVSDVAAACGFHRLDSFTNFFNSIFYFFFSC